MALSGVGINLARAIGPALGGLIVAAIGAPAVFWLNAASFVGVMLVLSRWRRPPRPSALPAEQVLGAMRAGVRYIRHAPAVRAVLMRAGLFILCGSAVWALLSLVARRELGLDAIGYGRRLGSMGAGAIGGARPGGGQRRPDHPHRGFETVTYLLEGRLQHQDSPGHAGWLGPGDVQWMTAGAGVVHSEMPEAKFTRTAGRMRGFQLWVNCPSATR